MRTVWLLLVVPTLSWALPPEPRRVVLVAGLSPAELVETSTAVAAFDAQAVLLPDTPAARPALRAFLRQYQPTETLAFGSFPSSAKLLESRYGRAMTRLSSRDPDGRSHRLAGDLCRAAPLVVVAPSEPFDQLLQSAALALSHQAPLWLWRGPPDAPALRRQLVAWKTQHLIRIGKAAEQFDADTIACTDWADKTAAARAHRDHLRRSRGLSVVVVANPNDRRRSGGLSAFAPWVAFRKQAALLLTHSSGTDADRLLLKAASRREFADLDAVLLLGDLQALPVVKRPNPLPGKDKDIEMEPGTPWGDGLFSLATGRLFHSEPAIALMLLDRQRLLAEPGQPRRALVASNPGGSLPLLETFSRQTAQELRNRGYQTLARFGHELTPAQVRQALPRQDLFLWEGHYKTLTEEYGLPNWNEPLKPALVFLQSCLALNAPLARPLFERGAIALIGSSTRTYSGTGGAFTLAYFDAMLYDGQSLGASLRSAKNFLLLYSRWKNQRLSQTRWTGANLRSAWAFSLWGDPTMTLPAPPLPDTARPGVAARTDGQTVTVRLPDDLYPSVRRFPYVASTWPNARLAGLVSRNDQGHRQLPALVFAEVKLEPRPGREPVLSSRLPSRDWEWLWDARRGCGYLLARPRPHDAEQLTFRITWKRLNDDVAMTPSAER